jgi:hypothetical protein
VIDEDVKATHLETIASCLGVSEVKDPDAFIAAMRGLVGMSSEDESESEDGPASKKPIDLAIVLGKGKK